MYLASRNVTEKEFLSKPLVEYRQHKAYVLLGEPGMGKTESFKMETEACNGKYIKARYFVTEGAGPNWSGETLFIDGLDEMRAGSGSSKTPLELIRQKLIELNQPGFRLSCREADWLGSSDIEALERITADGEITQLRLDPLDNDQIRKILRTNFSVEDPQAFINEALDRRLFDLLHNPQNLRMLAEAVQGSKWPETREQTYDLACKKLLCEPNKEHRNAQRFSENSETSLLDAAGYINAILLLAGIEGWALDTEAITEFFPLLAHLENKENLPISKAIKTRIFNTEDEHSLPVHRSIAEYLGARYLAKLVNQKHTPLGRVVALMLSPDGGVVAQLRGLNAWLAVHCLDARNNAIQRDPLGIVLYGDVVNFSNQDKRLILKSLASEAEKYAGFRNEDWNSRPFAALATKDMEETFRSIIQSPDRSESHLAVLSCVLDALQHGQLLNLTNELETLVRDRSYRHGLQGIALSTLCRDLKANSNRLLALLNDIVLNQIEDPNDDLLGKLLSALYPSHIKSNKIVEFLHPPKQENLFAAYYYFWNSLSENTEGNELPSLLDSLAETSPFPEKVIPTSHAPIFSQQNYSRMRGQLLARGVDLFGNQISDDRLYRWLGVGIVNRQPEIEDENAKQITAWLEKNTYKYKAIILQGLSICKEISTNLIAGNYMYDVEQRLYNAKMPDDLGRWHLDLSTESETEHISKYHFESAIRCMRWKQGDVGLKREHFEQRAKSNKSFQQIITSWLNPRETPRSLERKQKSEQQQKKEEKEQKARIAFYEEKIDSIRSGTAEPNILHQLGGCYFDHFLDIQGETPEQRLSDFFGGNERLVTASLEGLVNTLKRKDFPDIAKIVKLRLSGQLDFLCSPALAGLAELTKGNPNKIEELSNNTITTLVAFFFSYGVHQHPDWFIYLAKQKPQLISEILSIFVPKYLRGGEDSVPLVYALAYDELFGEVARLSVPALLKGFPSRARKNQLEQLKQLLTAAHRFVNKKELLPIIKNKLQLKSIDTGQRVYWMASGLLMQPQQYENQALDYIGRNQTRAHHFIAFLTDRRDQWDLTKELSTASMEILINLLGADSSPEKIKDSMYASPTGEFIHGLIHELSTRTNQNAADTLEKLLGSTALNHWKIQLKRARYNQEISKRRATFHHVSVPEVENTLMNQQPANHADLNALTLIHIKDIADKLRNGNSNGYTQYWNQGKYGRCETPKLENDCRNTLLLTLQERLIPLQIDALAEGQYAENKRADIRVWFGGNNGINIPIEIKRDSDKDLWKAIYGQLIPRYTRDPGANGYGIFLVFWFGGKRMPAPPDGERKPRSAAELENRLRETIKPVDSPRIKVCVIDCSCDQSKQKK